MDPSFQLYSARNYPLDSTLRTLGQLGYAHVEGFGGLDASSGSGFGGIYSDLGKLKSLLAENGLTMPSGHFGLDLIQQPDRALEVVEALGVQVVVCPWLAPDQRPRSASGWTELGGRLNELAQPFVARGLQFGYHNHDFEFAPTEGEVPLELVLRAAPDVDCELDVAWVYRGEGDAFAFLEKYGSRIVAVHVKDLAPAGENSDEDGWADVGHGTLPWQELLSTARSRTGARYFVAEHDNPSDVTRFARRSIEAAKSFGV